MNDTQTFGRYRVVEELGRGGMAIVYSAEDPMIGRNVALKVIQRAEQLHGMDADELQARFEREVQSAGVLTHPNIIHVYDVGTEDGAWWFAMELAAGDSLEKRLASGERIPLETALGWARSLADALDHSHRHGVVHRDVKPANILFTETGVPKISDFGIARVTDTDLTRDGKVLGTPAYMSPEQAAGEHVDGASDQFSLAVVLYHALTGEKPFDGSTPTAVLLQIVKEMPPAPSQVNPDLPAAVDAVFERALAKKPDERYPSCEAFVEQLEKSVDALPPTMKLGAAEAATEVLDSTSPSGSGPATAPTVTGPATADTAADETPGLDDLSAGGETGSGGDITGSGDSRRAPVAMLVAAALAVAALALGFFLYRGATDVAADGVDPPAAAAGAAGPEAAARTADDPGPETAGTESADGGGEDAGGTPESATEALPAPAPGERVSEMEGSLAEDVTTAAELGPDDGTTGESSGPTVTTEAPEPEFQVNSTPEGARVLLDGEEVGVTPLTVRLAPEQEHRLRVVAEGYEPASWAFSLADLSESQRQERALFFPLEPSTPPARLRVDAGYAIGLEATPTDGGDTTTAGPAADASLSLPPGEYRVQLTAPEVFLQRTITVELASEQERVLPTPAVVSITVAATPGNCRVSIDGRFVDATPFQVSLVEGDHEFRFEWPGVGETVTVTRTISSTTERVFETVPR